MTAIEVDDLEPTVVGAIVSSRWKIAARLAEGSMWVLYLAQDEKNSRRRVVLKFPKKSLLYERGFRERFDRETSSLLEFEHPRFVRVYDTGTHNDWPYGVLQYMHGGSLGDRIRERRQTLEELAWLPQVAAALDAIHKQGIIHRDVKVTNILFDVHGEAYLSDFGFIKIVASLGTDGELTQGALLGSPDSFAPECVDPIATPITPAYDQFGLAMAVYRALSGRQPFHSHSTMKLLMKLATEPPPPLDQVAPVPVAIANVVAKAMSIDPAARFASCGEFASALAQARQSPAIESPSAGEVIASSKIAASIREDAHTLVPSWVPSSPAVANTLEVNAPEVTAREASSAQASALEMNAPEVTAREASSAQAGAFEMNAPEVTAREASSVQASALEVNAPEVTAREASSAQASALEMNAPEVTAREASSVQASVLEVNAPEVNAPEASSAQASALEMNAPEANAPEASARKKAERSQEGASSGATLLKQHGKLAIGIAAGFVAALAALIFGLELAVEARQAVATTVKPVDPEVPKVKLSVAATEKQVSADLPAAPAAEWPFQEVLEPTSVAETKQLSPKEMGELGRDYLSGSNGKPQNDIEAAQWFRRAAERNDAFGQMSLGYMYERGRGKLAKDNAAAVKWYKLAAEQGNTVAQVYLADMYETGRGVAKDEAAAAKWYMLAAEQGSVFAQVSLGIMYMYGVGALPQDEAGALQWFQRAAEQGDAGGQTRVGMMYENGAGGVPQDDVAAAKWYKLAAEQGYALAQSSLASMYIEGRGGLAQDAKAAVKWYKLAAQQGSAPGQLGLGTMYLEGLGGLAKDGTAAAKWIGLAADQGNKRASSLMTELAQQGNEYAKRWVKRNGT